MQAIRYSPSDVIRLARITYRQLQYWVKEAEIVEPAFSGGSKGDFFDFLNIIEFKVVKALKERGVAIRDLRSLVEAIEKELPKFLKPHTNLFMLTDGLSKCVIGRPAALVGALKEMFEDQSEVFAIPIGDIWQKAVDDARALKHLEEDPDLRREPAA